MKEKMKEKMKERLNQKLSNFYNYNVGVSVISYRYGELMGILDSMRECSIITIEMYIDYTKLVNSLYVMNMNYHLYMDGDKE